MESALCGDICQFGGDRAGISSQTALLMAFGQWSLLQIIGTSLDGVTAGLKCPDRAGIQTGFSVTV